MKTTIDSAGRVVIPKSVRQEAGLRTGAEVEVWHRDGRIQIQPAPLRVKLIRKGRLLVAVPLEKIPPLGRGQVEDTRRRIRTEREGEQQPKRQR